MSPLRRRSCGRHRAENTVRRLFTSTRRSLSTAPPSVVARCRAHIGEPTELLSVSHHAAERRGVRGRRSPLRAPPASASAIGSSGNGHEVLRSSYAWLGPGLVFGVCTFLPLRGAVARARPLSAPARPVRRSRCVSRLLTADGRAFRGPLARSCAGNDGIRIRSIAAAAAAFVVVAVSGAASGSEGRQPVCPGARVAASLVSGDVPTRRMPRARVEAVRSSSEAAAAGLRPGTVVLRRSPTALTRPDAPITTEPC